MPATGDLTEYVEVQAESRTPNGQGGYTTSWTKLSGRAGNEWANIRGLSGDEALQAGVQRSVQVWRVIVPRRADITPKHRIIWEGLTLDIKSTLPLPDDPRFYTLMICESGLVS